MLAMEFAPDAAGIAGTFLEPYVALHPIKIN
jgi:hypothetical protein